MYFTTAAKPPERGLLRPLPKRPSTTSVAAESWGGSKLTVTSVNCTEGCASRSRFLLAAQSSESLLWILNRKTLTW